MRKLASVQRVLEKKPIVGADLVEAYRVNGWWVVDKKEAYRDWETDRKSTRLNSSHSAKSRMPSSA